MTQEATQTTTETATTQATQAEAQAAEGAQPSRYDQLLAARPPLKYPHARVVCPTTGKEGDWEAEFTGQAVARLLDLKLAMTESGQPQVWARGVVIRDNPKDMSKAKPDEAAQNPGGLCYSLRPGNDVQGCEGFASVEGHEFVCSFGFEEKAENSEKIGQVEISFNSLKAFGWNAKRLVDFVPADNEPSVLASKLGMDREVLVLFNYKPAEGDFPAKVQLGRVVPVDPRATVDTAALLEEKLADYLAAAQVGRVDTRRQSVKGLAVRMGLREAPSQAAQQAPQRSAPAGAPQLGGAVVGSGGAQPRNGKCGKPIPGKPGQTCNKIAGHDTGPDKTVCSVTPF